jgi:hypothetical protein
MLISVSNEIQSHLYFYTSFDEIEIEIEKWDNLIVKIYYQKILDENECL